jgi:GNAT superfamily N-acetyltransferase
VNLRGPAAGPASILRVSYMSDRIEIVRLHSLPSGLEHLRDEAVRHGFGFLDRLIEDWTGGTNNFSGSGECLLGALADGRLVGIGGLNADPYLPRVDLGRVRHVYVLEAWRRKGVGQAIIGRLVREAQGRFSELRLRTDRTAAAAFYIGCGFGPVDDPSASHSFKLVGCAQHSPARSSRAASSQVAGTADPRYKGAQRIR